MAEIVLTREQQEVVENRGGTLLVSAAAGSGKTKVLLDRVLKRVEEEQVDLDDFLLITYTKAAAAELRGKLLAQLNERLTKTPDDRHLQRQMHRVYLAQISTVHSFCGKLLREYAHELDIPSDFHICEEMETLPMQERAMLATLDEIYTAPQMDAEYGAAVDMLSKDRDDENLPEVIRQLYRNVQCHCDPGARLQELRECMDLTRYSDAGQTPWGSFLLGELHLRMAECEKTLKQALALIRGSRTMTPYLPMFEEDLRCAQMLKEAGWEDAHRCEPPFSKLRPIRSDDEKDLRAQVQQMRKRVKSQMEAALSGFVLPSEAAMHDLEESAQALRGLLRLTERYTVHYKKEKRRRHAMDYNDLEHEALRLLIDRYGRPTAAAREISERFAEVMVDEYQDTNVVQDTIFRAISKDEKNLFFVGDVKQAIYRFRMADPTIFLEKYRTFADYTQVIDDAPRKILLSDNFRSHPAILEAANDVFRLTMTERVGGLRYGDAEALRTPLTRPEEAEKPAVELHCINSSGENRSEIEAEFVARRIAQMLREGEVISEKGELRPVTPEDIVILMRSISDRAEIYIRALKRHGIRCVYSKENIFDTEEIRLLTALLQVIDNPHQDIPLLTVLLSPIFGVSADTLARLRAQHSGGDVYDVLEASDTMQPLIQKLTHFRDLAQTDTLRTLLDTLEEELHLRALLHAMEHGEERIANLDAFFALADAYESGDHSGLAGFLRYLEGQHGGTTHSGESGAVRLMTVHTSKGLEFPVVFLANLCGKFNSADARQTILTDPVLGIGTRVRQVHKRLTYPTIAHMAITAREALELRSDEMRILYVGMTRPKNRLIMTCCAAYMPTHLAGLVKNMTLPPEASVIETAPYAADWVLLAALRRTEAGALFAVAGYPQERNVSGHPWKITYQEASELHPSETDAEEAETAIQEALLQPQFFTYPFAPATQLPSKLTATQLKGRELDVEISDNTAPQKPQIPFVRPQLHSGKRPLSPTERGTAIHLAMQYIKYERCADMDGVVEELDRLQREEFLTPQQREAVPAQKIWRFFCTPIGQRVLNAPKLIREFKFSLLQDAALLDPGLQDEQVLLQGVTDCCIFEHDGLTVLDFKSDRVAPGEEAARAEYYRGQLDAYSSALSRIFNVPVKERVLYFFATDTAFVMEERR